MKIQKVNKGNFRDTLYSKYSSDIFPVKIADSIYLHFSYTDSIIKQIIDSDLLEKKEYVYSDLGYYLLKQIIEDISNENLKNYTSSNFYDKLGMENLSFFQRIILHLKELFQLKMITSLEVNY